jgi:hypothetical protein
MAIGGTLPSLADRTEPHGLVRLLVGRYLTLLSGRLIYDDPCCTRVRSWPESAGANHD